MLTKGAAALSAKLAPLMTAAELARRLGVTPQAVSGWIKGKAIPTPETLRAIEDALGIPMRAWTEPVE
jgi:transcriptional regulator with XRE-family HTH domain